MVKQRINSIGAGRGRVLAVLSVLAVLCAGALSADADGTVKIDPGDIFNGDIDRLDVFAHFNDTSDVLTMSVGPDDILDGTEDNRKLFTLPADREFILYARAMADTEYRISLLAQNLGPAVMLNEGGALTGMFNPVEILFLPSQFIMDPFDSVLLRLVFQYSDGELTDVDRSYFYVVFAVPPEAGTLTQAGQGYVFTGGGTPGTYDVTATVKIGAHPLHSYLEPIARATALLTTVVLESPGGMALTKNGTLYISDTKGGFVSMIPWGKKGFALVRGLDKPGDVELSPDEKTLFVTETGAKVCIVKLGLTGQLRDLDGNLIVGASIVIEVPAGGTPGTGSTMDMRKTNKEGLFHVFDLLGSSTTSGIPTASSYVPVFMTVEHAGKSYSLELPVPTNEGHSFLEVSLDTVELTTSKIGQGSVYPTEGAHTYPRGFTLAFEAVPNAGWQFDRWEGALTGSNNPKILVIDDDKQVTAVFVAL